MQAKREAGKQEAIYIGRSSHNSQLDAGAERGFTLLYSSKQRFFLPGERGSVKMNAEIAANAAPANVRDWSW